MASVLYGSRSKAAFPAASCRRGTFGGWNGRQPAMPYGEQTRVHRVADDVNALGRESEQFHDVAFRAFRDRDHGVRAPGPGGDQTKIDPADLAPRVFRQDELNDVVHSNDGRPGRPD